MSHSLLEITDNPNLSTNDYIVARNIAECLHKHYPGHLWGVTCEGTKGIATIRNLRLSGNWGFVIRLQEFFGDTEMRLVKQAGGEILERYYQRRGKADTESILDLPMLPQGVPIFDHEASKTKVPAYIVRAVDRNRRLRA